MRRKLRVILACTAFGAVSGAACGALLTHLSWFPAPVCASALLGAATGAVVGLLGGLIGGPFGWFVAGAMGSLAANSSVATYLIVRAPLQEAQVEHLNGWLFLHFLVAVTGALGAMVGWGVEDSASPVLPGVRRLRAFLDAAEAPPRPRDRAPSPEVTPAMPPGGTGDEAVPTMVGVAESLARRLDPLLRELDPGSL